MSHPSEAVPYVDWNKTAFLQFPEIGSGPAPLISRLTAASVASVAALPLEPLYPKYSYSIRFVGPSFRYTAANASGEDALFDSMKLLGSNVTLEDALGQIHGNLSYTPIHVAGHPFRDDIDNTLLILTTNSNISCTLRNTSYDV